MLHEWLGKGNKSDLGGRIKGKLEIAFGCGRPNRTYQQRIKFKYVESIFDGGPWGVWHIFRYRKLGLISDEPTIHCHRSN